jgi:hypothetical protein
VIKSTEYKVIDDKVPEKDQKDEHEEEERLQAAQEDEVNNLDI